MKKFRVNIVFPFELVVEAEDEEQAENKAYDEVYALVGNKKLGDISPVTHEIEEIEEIIEYPCSICKVNKVPEKDMVCDICMEYD